MTLAAKWSGDLELRIYNCKDNIQQANLCKRYQARLKDYPHGEALFKDLTELNLIADEMCWRGVKVDQKRRMVHSLELANRAAFRTSELQKLLRPFGLTEFNPRSSAHLRKLYLDVFECQPKGFTDGGAPAFDEASLTGYFQDERPLVVEVTRQLLKLRKWQNLKSTHVDGLRLDTQGVAHPFWRPGGAKTGRWASSSPNVLNIPKPLEERRNGKKVILHSGLRDMYITHKPRQWVVEADYSQIELRICALLAGDKPLLDTFQCGADPHSANAWDLFFGDKPRPVPLTKDSVTKSERTLAKNFAYLCVPMHTQALTRKGWKNYHELHIGDIILAYDPETNTKRWEPIQELTYHKNAEVWSMGTSKSFKVETTPDHRWAVRQRTWAGRSYAKPYMSEIQERTTRTVNTESNIIVNAPMEYDEGAGTVTPWTEQKYGTDWVEAVCSMSTEQRQAWLNGFLLADGHFHKQSEVWTWSQKRGHIFEAALAATAIEHHGATWVNDTCDGMVYARLSKKSHVTGQKLKRERIADQPVWCPTVATGYWVMRQGNCVTVTGNSNYGGDETKLWLTLLPDFPNYKLKTARHHLRRWFTAHPAIKRYQETSLEFAKAHMYVEDPLSHRRRYFWQYPPKPTEVYNFPIQTASATIINRAMKRVNARLKWPKEGILFQYHDALVLSGPDPYRLACILQEELTKPVTLNGHSTSFPIDIEFGKSFGVLDEVSSAEDLKTVGRTRRRVSAKNARTGAK